MNSTMTPTASELLAQVREFCETHRTRNSTAAEHETRIEAAKRAAAAAAYRNVVFYIDHWAKEMEA